MGIPTVMGIAETNPAVEVYRKHTFMTPAGNSAAKMRQAVKAMVEVACDLAEGRHPSIASFLPRGVRELTLMESSGASRAVAMLSGRLAGQEVATELPLPKFDRVDPAPPLQESAHRHHRVGDRRRLGPEGKPGRD